VIINGSVDGNVYSSRHLELASKARVQGNVFYSLVEMAAGAEVNGNLAHMAETDTPQGKKGEAPSQGAEPVRRTAGVAAISGKLDENSRA
jgi:cytoskeletal protein CcmA (bactofilin family)